jgi:hypothetical protein
MQAKKRYILVFICAFLLFCYFGGFHLKILQKLLNYTSRTKHLNSLPNFLQDTNFGVSSIIDNRNNVNFNTNLNQNNNNKNVNANFNNNNKNSDDLLNLPDNTGPSLAGPDQLPSAGLHDDGYMHFANNKLKPCRMETCFDFTKCYTDFLGKLWKREKSIFIIIAIVL